MRTTHDADDLDPDGFRATIDIEWSAWAASATVRGRTHIGEEMPGCRAPTKGYLPPSLLPDHLDAELVARSVWRSEEQAERYRNFIYREVRQCVEKSASGLPFSATVRLVNGQARDLNYASCDALVRVLGGLECLSDGIAEELTIPCSFTGRELVERLISDDWGAPPVGMTLHWTSAAREAWQVGISFSDDRCFSRHRLERPPGAPTS